MSIRAILFALCGIMLFGGISAYWVMSDMARIRKENAAKAALQPQTSGATGAGVGANGQPPATAPYSTGQQDSYGGQNSDPNATGQQDPYGGSGNVDPNAATGTDQQQYTDPNSTTGSTGNGQYTDPGSTTGSTGNGQYTDPGTTQNGTTGSTDPYSGNTSGDAPANSGAYAGAGNG